jgi:hypothetical protein
MHVPPSHGAIIAAEAQPSGYSLWHSDNHTALGSRVEDAWRRT